MNEYILIVLITFVACFIQGLSGFGSILLALPLLAIFLDIKTVIPLVALQGLFSAVLLLIGLRKDFEWKKVLPLFAGSIPGVPVGVFFLKTVSTGSIQMALGLIVVSYACFGLYFRPVWESKQPGPRLRVSWPVVWAGPSGRPARRSSFTPLFNLGPRTRSNQLCKAFTRLRVSSWSFCMPSTA